MRRSLRLQDRFDCGRKSMRHGDDPVTSADASCNQSKAQSIGAAAHPDAMAHIAVISEVPFKSPHDRAATESRGSQHASNRFQQFGFEFQVRSDKIDEWNACLFSHVLSLLDTEYLRIRAGFPATIAFGGTSLVTTLPAPTSKFSPMVTFARIVAPEPIETPFFTNVRSTFQPASV